MRTKVSGGVTTGYTYDGAGRLSSEGNGVISVTYGYDAANNRTSMNVGGVVTTYAYDANNRLLSESKAGTVKSYTYDANGSQLTGNGLITYDARGRQSTWTNGLTTASYTYYPNDLRKSKTVGGTTSTFVWDEQNMVYEYSGTNATGGKAYYYGLTLISQGNDAYYLYNGHGDVVQLVTSTGTLGRSYDYDAFGNEVNAVSGDTNPFRYAGQYFDSETGTYYLRARYYNPSIGRFTQQDGWQFADSRDPLSLNLYTYCFNNPIRYVDYSGNSVTDIIAGLSLSLDANLIGGFGKWLSEKMAGHYQYYAWDSEYDYYLGRVIGDAIGILVGAGMSVKGILDIVAAISSGAGVTIGSAGTAAIGGVAIAAAGVAAGVIEISYGATVVYAAASNFGDDWKKFDKANHEISESTKNLKTLDDKYLKKHGIDPHKFKKEILSTENVRDKTLAHYNIARDTYTNELYLIPNANKPAIATGIFLK